MLTKIHLKRGLSAGLVAVLIAGASPAVAASLADPTYQVKLRLAEKAVTNDGSPSDEFRKAFSVLRETGNEESVYFDTADSFYSKNGWSIRLRHKDGEDKMDITYKYRQPLYYNSLSKDVVEKGLIEARENNFDASDTNYRAQINASYNHSTLDFSNRKHVPCITAQCEIPAVEESIKLVAGKEPGKLQKASGTTIASKDLLMSPMVSQQTWAVEIDGIKTDLEVSTFADRVWVEISEDETSRKDAIRKRDQLISALREADLLLEVDAFKTASVLSIGRL